MPDDPASKFEPISFLEKLLNMRATDPAQFNAFPEELKKIVEDYEKEKQAAVKED